MTARPVPNFAESEPSSTAMLNATIDLWESNTRLVIDAGGEAALLARLRRLMPDAFPLETAQRAQAVALTADDALLAASGASILAGMAKARRTHAGRGQLETIAGLLARVASALKGAQ